MIGRWNADELGPHFIAGEPHPRIAVTAHIHEFKVRGQLRIGNGVSALQVETLGVFEARADAVLEEHVAGPVGLTRWPIGQERRTERMILELAWGLKFLLAGTATLALAS